MNSAKSSAKPNSGRRSFLWKAGAAVSAAAAVALPGMGKISDGKDTDADRLAKQVGMLEDEKAIRALHATYENLLQNGRYEEVAGLFAKDAVVVFHNGMFKGRRGVSRLYGDHFRAGLIGRKIGPVPGFEAVQETITVAADRRSAKAQFPYSIQVGAPVESNLSLVQMARLHGEGIAKWCEAGICDIAFAADAKDGGWKIAKLEYRATSTTDYRPGKAYANPVSVSQFARTYPQDPSGPDRLVT